MKKLLVVSMSALFASNAFGVLIDFNDLADNDILGSQYAGLGVNFIANNTVAGLPNPTSSTEGFATNSSMEVATISGGDVGGLGTPSLLSGTVVHSFDGWLSEDGDATMTMNFDTAVSSVSLDFGGIAELGFTGLYAIDGAGNIVASALATATGQQTVTLSGVNVNQVVVIVGSFGDWVGVDNLNFEAVPEPATMVVLGGAALLAAARRRKK